MQDKIYQFKQLEPVIMGTTIVEKSLFKNKEPQTIQLYDHSYPMLISGSTGAGKTETLLTMANQYIENNEGCIYVDAKGDSSIFYKLLGFCHQGKRQADLYALNFMYGSGIKKGADNKPLKKLSNSFDPINPLIGQPHIFEDLFGMDIGAVFNNITIIAKSKNWLINIDNIEAICMLPNLIKWAKNNYWDSATPFIETYLNSIGYNEDGDDNDFEELIEQHALKCQKIKSIIDIVKPYYDYDVFSITPEIDMESIFKDRKILLIMFPTLEKSTDLVGKLANLITSQITYFSQLNSSNTETNNQWQNIIIDDFFYSINDEANPALMKALGNKQNHWVFATQDFYYLNKKVFDHVVTQCQTFVIMQTSSRNINLPSHLKLMIFDNIENIPPIFAKNISAKDSYYIPFDQQREGMAYIFTPKIDSSYRKIWLFERINCKYTSSVRLEWIRLNRFETNVILE